MEINFDQLVASLAKPPITNDLIYQLTSFIEQQSTQPLISFVSQSFQSLLILQQWTWQLLTQDPSTWINQPSYIQLFHVLASFNKLLIFTHDKIDNDIKVSLLIPETIDQLNQIFKHIQQTNDDNDPYLTIVNLWFDNYSYFFHDNLQYTTLCVFDHIGEYFTKHCLMSKELKYYLNQLRQTKIAESIFTSKMLFYMKTCLFYLYTYIGIKLRSVSYSVEEILHYISSDYLEIIHIHSHHIATWNRNLLACIAHLMPFLCRCCWWDGQKRTQMKIILPSEQSIYEYLQDLMRIVAYAMHYEHIEPQRSNDQTTLFESSVLFVVNMVETQDVNYFFRTNTEYQKIISTIAETSINDFICVSAYRILNMVLTDEQIKELKITDNAAKFCMNILEQTWYQSSIICREIPIFCILQGIRDLSKSDCLQQKIADFKKIPLFMEISDQYPIVYDIFWALSFNKDIQQQLRSNSIFMSKLSHLAKKCDNEQMRKTIHGILWNLEINHENRPTIEINDRDTFDMMISYSHKDKTLCHQIYDELVKAGYRVWIDIDQMHGNVMDAMAQAIESSQTVIICMSEEYRKSNYCRAEAHYAFQRERKIVPVLLQSHYRPEGWLLFLVGQLKYIDFIKYEFSRAMEMLSKELKTNEIPESHQPSVRLEQKTDIVAPTRHLSISKSSSSSSSILSQNILEWTSSDVQTWLIDHDLNQMSRLLVTCNGRSLVYLSNYMKVGRSEQVLKSFQADSVRKTGEEISFIELSCFRSLMNEQRRLLKLSRHEKMKTNDNNKNG